MGKTDLSSGAVLEHIVMSKLAYCGEMCTSQVTFSLSLFSSLDPNQPCPMCKPFKHLFHWNLPCPWAIARIERKQQYPLLPAMPCKEDLFRNFPSTYRSWDATLTASWLFHSMPQHREVFWEEWEIRWSRATIPASPRNTHGLNRPQLCHCG